MHQLGRMSLLMSLSKRASWTGSGKAFCRACFACALLHDRLKKGGYGVAELAAQPIAVLVARVSRAGKR
jgi:hypothetical protein